MNSTTGLLGIEEPDGPIYRIFPLWFFEETLRVRNLALLPPDSWDDPFEVFPSEVAMLDENGKQHMLGQYLSPVFAQCWSRTRESDTLLRAYSRVAKDMHHKRNTIPREEGVRVRSTPRRLLEAVKNWAAERPGISCFIGAVKYKSNEAIYDHVGHTIVRHGPSAVGRGQLRAELLLLKREMFSHEAEIRLVCVDDRPEVPKQELIQIPFEPSSVFDEVTFDPRLEEFERQERETVARKLGYGGEIVSSVAYAGISLLFQMPPGWKLT
jgi:hypothetical protein